ncbi:UNVERIFIED_CONTAM: hypothetical protein GTU68_023888, partial [Idotea baltica]|nr:hypothetical protein [Idotea baltica]
TVANATSFVPLEFEFKNESHLIKDSEAFLSSIQKRRTVRDFSSRAVPESVIANAIKAAGSAPSGANMQPWHFVAVSNAQIKQQIRKAAEIEERELYEHRASDEWLDALAPLGTDANKPFLETAPWLIAVFAQKYTLDENGNKKKHYYTPESVGIATGFLIAALHNAGLATLTHTPSPMGFLRDILDRPTHEKPFLLLVTGYPTDDALIPNIDKKPASELISWKK